MKHIYQWKFLSVSQDLLTKKIIKKNLYKNYIYIYKPEDTILNQINRADNPDRGSFLNIVKPIPVGITSLFVTCKSENFK